MSLGTVSIRQSTLVLVYSHKPRHICKYLFHEPSIVSIPAYVPCTLVQVLAICIQHLHMRIFQYLVPIASSSLSTIDTTDMLHLCHPVQACI